MRRQVWSVEEIRDILAAMALAGGDRRTLALVAIALGLSPVLIGEEHADVVRVLDGVHGQNRR